MEPKTGPLYVKVDEFKSIADTVRQLKTKLNEAHELLGKLEKLKQKEDSALDEWKQNLDEASRKLNVITSTLFE